MQFQSLWPLLKWAVSNSGYWKAQWSEELHLFVLFISVITRVQKAGLHLLTSHTVQQVYSL